MRNVAGGVAFALVLAGAATQVYPSGLGLPGFAIAVWIYAWPIVLALVMSAVAGFVAVVLALFSPRGADAVVAVAVSLGCDVRWLVGATCLLALGGLDLLAEGRAILPCRPDQIE